MVSSRFAGLRKQEAHFFKIRKQAEKERASFSRGRRGSNACLMARLSCAPTPDTDYLPLCPA